MCLAWRRSLADSGGGMSAGCSALRYHLLVPVSSIQLHALWFWSASGHESVSCVTSAKWSDCLYFFFKSRLFSRL